MSDEKLPTSIGEELTDIAACAESIASEARWLRMRLFLVAGRTGCADEAVRALDALARSAAWQAGLLDRVTSGGDGR
jgi:hypothetical protein